MSNQNGNPNALLRICCVITRADPDIAHQSNRFDQRTIAFTALLLICQFALASSLWAVVLAIHIPTGAAVFGGVLIGLIIFLLDQAISASDWALRGILRRREPFFSRATFERGVEFVWRTASRLALAGLFSMTTGHYATLWLFKETIDNHIQGKQSAQNAVVEEEYARLKTDLESRHARLLLGPEKELDLLTVERGHTQRRIDDALSDRREAAEQVSKARIEMGREEDGLNRPKGRGAKYHDAQRREQEASYRLSRLDESLRVDKSRLDELESRIAQLQKTYEERSDKLQAQLHALYEKRQHDPRFVPARIDFLGRDQALAEIKNGPYGGSAAWISYLTIATLLALELAFFFTTQFAAPASVYNYRLIARTLFEAQQVDTELARNMRDLGGPEDESAAPIEGSTASGFQDPPGGGEAPLFDPSCVQQAVPDGPIPDHDSSGADASEAQRYEVIGGAPGERVSRTEAEANRRRYWVNPERPEEIWDARHRAAILGPHTDQ